MQKDADRTKGTPGYPVYLNRPSPQESPSAERSTSRGESADKEKTYDEHSRAAPEETVPEEIESMKAPPDIKTGRSLRTCLSRGVPADHEARSQVKVNEKEREKQLQKEDGIPQNIEAWGRPRARQERSVRTRRAIAADSSANP